MTPTNNTPPTETDAQQPSCEGLDDAICSRQFLELIEALDDWGKHFRHHGGPVSLTLMRAGAVLKDQNKELYRLREQVRRLRGALSMWRMEGPDSNACWCDACLAMHGAHPAHSEECNAARDAMDSSANNI